MFDDTVTALASMIEARDPYTAGHQRRVACLAQAVGEEMGLPEDRIHGLAMGARVHDIGKVSIPAALLRKPGRINEHEFGIIKAHPLVGHGILREIECPWPLADIVLQHHERLDGSGYPNGLKGDEILLESRIVAVADVVEAISSHRPYRPALGLERSLEEIQEQRGVFYDPDVVDACVHVMQNGFALA
jgi:HD-GYP domain-containing protein (c-di-GMP phosphodiesterase class II)